MRTLLRMVTALVILLLISTPDTATAGVAWFQPRDEHIGDRAGAGVLTVPPLVGAQIGKIGEVVMWTSKRVLVSSAGVVSELTFPQGESIEDTLGVAVIAFPVGGEDDATLAGLVIWTPKRVLLAVADDVFELTFQGESIAKPLGVLAFVFNSSGVAGGLVIWTQKRVLITTAEGLSEVTFQGRSIMNTLGAVLVRPGASDGGGLVLWTADRVLVSGGGPANELTFPEGKSIDDTLGVLPLPSVEAETHFVVWTTDRVLAVSGAVVSELTFEGHAIKSKVETARQPFRRQADSLFTSLYEAEARLHGARGSLLMSVPILESGISGIRGF